MSIIFIFFLVIFSFCQNYDLCGDIIKTKNGFQGTLKYDPNQGKGAPPDTIEFLDFQFFYETENRIHLKITDSNNSRWEVPDVVVSVTPPVSPSPLNFDIYVTNSPFSFKIVRKSDNYQIFNTNGFDFYFADQFIQMSTSLGSTNPNIYGIGERKHNFRLDPNDKTYVMFNKDHLTPVDENLYGTHPFYVEILNGTGNAHGIFILNSNAQEVNINGPGTTLTYRTIGGILDMYFFLGPTPKEVVTQYQEVIGKPYMPPYWSLGYHQSRYGLASLKLTADVVDSFKDNNIPLETMWNDIDFMDQVKDWTVDPVNYPLPVFQSFLSDLHTNNQHYIQILDVGIKNETGYGPYDRGEQLNMFIKEADGVHDLVGKVWPGFCTYPDWWSENGEKWFSNEMKIWYDQLPLDGLWIDMNEPSSFCNGQCSSPPPKSINNRRRKTEEIARFDPMNPPYTPGGVDLNEKTLRNDGKTSLGVLYNTHNLYGYAESKLAHSFLSEYYGPSKRPFLVTRSSFAGSGRYASKWTGDNSASFSDLFYSISGCLSLSMFGFSMVGSDICGFMGDTNAELCGRWMEVGAFYPFMRNHNAKGNVDQYPYSLGQQVLDTSKSVIHQRMSLLPYLYTLLWEAHSAGTMVMRPVIFEFPKEPKALLVDQQFMWGDGLLISPVVYQGVTSVNMYVPDDTWYDYYTFRNLKEKCPQTMTYCKVDAEIGTINVHIRAGRIIPRKVKNDDIMTTYDLRRTQPFEILVPLDENRQATGSLYLDDGETIDAFELGKYSQINFGTSPTSYSSGRPEEGDPQQVWAKPVKLGWSGTEERLVLGMVRVMGIQQNHTVTSVTVQGKPYSDWMFLTNDKVLVIQNLEVSLLSDISIEFQ